MERLKPTNDFIFKKLFGETGDENILISFLNAVLKKTHKPISEIIINDDTELTAELLDDKMGRIDVRARTIEGEEIDIEVQITDQKNMDKRTLFYWSKLYLEGITKGKDYKELTKVITINILDFEFTNIDKYHSSYHLWEDEDKNYRLTDIVEIHFIELPKFRRIIEKNYREDILQMWMMFFQQDTSREVLMEMSEIEPAIKQAEDKLEYLSSDPRTIARYRARENSEHERANIYSSGVERGLEQGLAQGIEQGLEQAKYMLAQNLLDVLDDYQIATKTGLSLEEVQELRKNNF